MIPYARFSFRNVWRHKRRTLLNIIAIAVNLAVIIVFISLYRGYITVMIDRIIEFQTGHFQIHHEDYLKEENLLLLDHSIPQPQALQKKLEGLPEIKAVGKRIEFKGSISNGIDRMGIFGVGFNPEKEANISLIHDAISEGQYLNSSDEALLIGSQLAENFKVHPGDTLKLYSRTKNNVHNLLELPIKGIFEVGFSEVDKYFVYLPYALADSFLTMNGEATELILIKNKAPPMAEVENKIKAILPSKDLATKRWTYYAEAFIQDIIVEGSFMALLLLILLVIAIFGILNTLSMAFMERTQEMGTLRALGFSKKQLFLLLISEVSWIGLFGSLGGWILGFGFSYYLATHGIQYDIDMQDMVNIPFENKILGKMAFTEYAAALGIGLISAWIGGLIPTWKTCRMTVINALKQH